jgi:arginase
MERSSAGTRRDGSERRGTPVDLLRVPYDSGHREARMGRGPGWLARHGLAGRLRAAGHPVTEHLVEPEVGFGAEVATAFALQRAVAERVRDADGFTLTLAGNCNATVGVAGGLGAGRGDGRVGVVWLDAHADLNTPETTTSGFLDGMALAMLTGRCWGALTATVPGFRPVPDEDVVLVGARDVEAAERDLLAASGIARVTAERVRERGVAAALGPALARLRDRVGRVIIHVDLDVHDPGFAPANPYPAPGGLDPEQVRDTVRLVAGELPLAAGVLAAYDPGCDVDDRMLGAALGLAELLAASATTT